MNGMYPEGRKRFLQADIDWLVDDVKAVLLSSTYVYSAAHDFHADLSGIIATSGNLTGKTSALGVADAADVTFAAVAAGDTVVAVALFKDTGVSATSPLIVFYDEAADTTPISEATTGGDITLSWAALGGLFTL